MSTPESRAQGCLFGQLAGDALGSQVEFMKSGDIILRHLGGLRELGPSRVWNTIAGQPTDDSEMALALARMLVRNGVYKALSAKVEYIRWLDSNPFDYGKTTEMGLRGRADSNSQANGALMRISPLGIFGAHQPPHLLARWAGEDAAITHPHPVCVQANILFTLGIAHAIKTGSDAPGVYAHILGLAKGLNLAPSLLQTITAAQTSTPDEYHEQQGWVLIAFQNALWQLLHAANTEAGIVNTVMRGGDTDTNGAICGALLGAVYGIESIPPKWIEVIENCRPQRGLEGVHQPRPEHFWPTDARSLATKLLTAGATR